MSGAYYNEFDPFAAAWLRELIKRGLIADGDVDARSIVDVRPDDLRGYTQCHFFAGIGVWSYALRSAGWPDDRPVWTGSCPCQPFSAAGKRGGFDDERHLWPVFFDLIRECRPECVLGEQVASKDGLAWLDALHADLEAADYACGAVDTCAAGFGAPHIRQRLYWVAYADDAGLAVGSGQADGRRAVRHEGQAAAAGLVSGGLADAGRERRERREGPTQGRLDDREDAGRQQGDDGPIRVGEAGDGSRPTGPTNGFWRDADWLFCRDGKWRPVEPGTFPLADGAAARVGRLRGYGNAIVAPQAQAFIEAVMDVIDAAGSLRRAA